MTNKYIEHALFGNLDAILSKLAVLFDKLGHINTGLCVCDACVIPYQNQSNPYLVTVKITHPTYSHH